MTTAKRIYTASYDQKDSAPSSGIYSDTRAYNYENFFGSNVYKNRTDEHTLLFDGQKFSAQTNKNDNNDWMKVINFDHIMKTAGGSSPANWGKFYWDVKTNYWNTTGMGAYYGGNSYFHPNVVGATFSWRKDQGYWSDGECGFNEWGLHYYQPSTNRWRTVRFNTNTSSGNHYYSQEGDDWVHHGGNPAALGTKVTGWKATRGYLSTTNKNYVMNEDWLWGGFFIRGECTDAGPASHRRELDLADFQPIYGYHTQDAKLCLQFGSVAKEDLSDKRKFR